MLDEIKYLGNAVSKPQHPFVAVLGGAKISGKIDVIRNLLDKCDTILVGGGMMFTFYKAMGYEIGKSLLEEDKVELASNSSKRQKRKMSNYFYRLIQLSPIIFQMMQISKG